jgi:hypothetical protein
MFSNVSFMIDTPCHASLLMSPSCYFHAINLISYFLKGIFGDVASVFDNFAGSSFRFIFPSHES